MEADDVSLNRLEAAKESAKKFIASLPEWFNVALATFAGAASVSAPSTADRGVLNRVIDNVRMAPSTTIGEAIYTSPDALRLVPSDPDHPDTTAPATIVLLSDGASNPERDLAAAVQQLKQPGVPIYAIAYGTQNGYVESNGRRERMVVDHHELYVIVGNFGDKKSSAESVGGLSEIYQAISSDLGYRLVPMETMDQYAGLAIIFTVLTAMDVISLRARWP